MKITKETLKTIIKEEINNIQEAEQRNPFTELNKAREAFKTAMELCNVPYLSKDYERFRAIKRKILDAVVACDFLIETLDYKGKPLGKGLRPIATSEAIIEVPKNY